MLYHTSAMRSENQRAYSLKLKHLGHAEHEHGAELATDGCLCQGSSHILRNLDDGLGGKWSLYGGTYISARVSRAPLLLYRSISRSFFETSAYLYQHQLATVRLCSFDYGAHDVWEPCTDILKSQRASTLAVERHYREYFYKCVPALHCADSPRAAQCEHGRVREHLSLRLRHRLHLEAVRDEKRRGMDAGSNCDSSEDTSSGHEDAGRSETNSCAPSESCGCEAAPTDISLVLK